LVVQLSKEKSARLSRVAVAGSLEARLQQHLYGCLKVEDRVLD
jgi:hypothetical protein